MLVISVKKYRYTQVASCGGQLLDFIKMKLFFFPLLLLSLSLFLNLNDYRIKLTQEKFLKLPGAPQARAQELSDAVTGAVFHHASMMMFELHYNLLLLLVSLERLRIERKASHKELSLFVNGFEKHGLDEAGILEQKPAWMDSAVSCLHYLYCMHNDV